MIAKKLNEGRKLVESDCAWPKSAVIKAKIWPKWLSLEPSESIPRTVQIPATDIPKPTCILRMPEDYYELNILGPDFKLHGWDDITLVNAVQCVTATSILKLELEGSHLLRDRAAVGWLHHESLV